jgi:hypothetical protein
MEVKLHFVMFDQVDDCIGYVPPDSGNSESAPGEPGTVARISIVRGADPGDVDFEFDEEL